MEQQSSTSLIIPAPAGWEDVFSHFYYAANDHGISVQQTLFPHFLPLFIFSYGEAPVLSLHGQSFTLGHCTVTTPLKKAISFTLPPGSEILTAHLRADTFFRFFRQAPLTEEQPLANPDRLVSLTCFHQLWQEAKSIHTADERISHLLHTAAGYLRDRQQAVPPLLQTLSGDHPFDPVKSAAASSRQHERTIQLHFRKYLGYTAKEWSRFRKFTQAVELLQISGTTDWFDIIDACGYYDQSHLIRDFRHFLGRSPSQYLKTQHNICIPEK